MSRDKYYLTEHILHILIDASTRREDDPEYELQEEEVASYEATLQLIERAQKVGI